MHKNVKRGNRIHHEHFAALRSKVHSRTAPGWEVWYVNKQIGKTGLRPDWVILNRKEKRAFILDVTAKYRRAHYQKGLRYKEALGEELRRLEVILDDQSWNIVYLEDYWLDATYH
jgi:hypothetical protein